MAKNPYFKYENSEQRLMEDLTIESIKSHGEDFLYIAREAFNRDDLFGEDLNSKFKDSAIIEMYVKSYESNPGSEMFSRFGIELKDRIVLVLSRKRFEECVTTFFTTIKRPREGDLIFSPMTGVVYEIQFVENEVPFFQGNKNYTYEIAAQTWTYNQEEVDTGIEVIDAVAQDKQELLTYLGLSAASGDFLPDEVVYVGATLENATFTAQVTTFNTLDPDSIWLKSVDGEVSDIVGETLKGSESGAEALVEEDLENETDHIQINPFETNDKIRKESRTIIDFSEVDPFSEGNY
jgi:hypothetical protein